MTTLQNINAASRKNYLVNNLDKISLTVTNDGFGAQSSQHAGIEQLKDTYTLPHKLSDYELISPYNNTINVYYLTSGNVWQLYKTHTFENIVLPVNPTKLSDSTSGGAVVSNIIQYESGRDTAGTNSPSKLLQGGLTYAYNQSPSTNIGLPIGTAYASLPSFWKFEGSFPFALYTNDESGEEYLASGWNRNNYNEVDLDLYQEYADRKGFHSDQNKITDSTYWQDYSYSILSPISIKDWEYAYKKMVHPAGLKLFNQLLLESTSNNLTKGSSEYNVFTSDYSWLNNLYLRTSDLYESSARAPYNNGYLPFYQPGWLDEHIIALYYIESAVNNKLIHNFHDVTNGALNNTYDNDRNFNDHFELGVNGYLDLHIGQMSTVDQTLESRYHIEIRGEDHTDNSPSTVATSGYFDINLKTKYVFEKTDWIMSQEGLVGTKYVGDFAGAESFFNTATKAHSSNDTPQLYTEARINGGTGTHSYLFEGEFLATKTGYHTFRVRAKNKAILRVDRSLETHTDRSVDDGVMKYNFEDVVSGVTLLRANPRGNAATDTTTSMQTYLEAGKYYPISYMTSDNTNSSTIMTVQLPGEDTIRTDLTGFFKNVLYRGTFDTDATFELPANHGNDKVTDALRFVSWYQELGPTAAEQITHGSSLKPILINAVIDQPIKAALIDPVVFTSTGNYSGTGASYQPGRLRTLKYSDHVDNKVHTFFRFSSSAIHDSPSPLSGTAQDASNKIN